MIIGVIVAALVYAGLVESVCISRSCPTNWTLWEDSCYFLNLSVRAGWGNSRKYCQSLGNGSDLAVLNSYREFLWVRQFQQPGAIDIYGCWVGAYSFTILTNFTWIDGRKLPNGSPYWNPLEPNNNNNMSRIPELCIHYKVKDNTTDAMGLNDYNCGATFHAVCERSAL